MVSDAMFSSDREDWGTPQGLFDRLACEFGPFDIDLAASEGNAKCRRFYTREDDSLRQVWRGRCWLNPPYGRQIGRWMAKAHDSVVVDGTASTVCALVPARTDTRWWHDFVGLERFELGALAHASVVLFLPGRVRFLLPDGSARAGAPFPSAVVVWQR